MQKFKKAFYLGKLKHITKIRKIKGRHNLGVMTLYQLKYLKQNTSQVLSMFYHVHVPHEFDFHFTLTCIHLIPFFFFFCFQIRGQEAGQQPGARRLSRPGGLLRKGVWPSSARGRDGSSMKTDASDFLEVLSLILQICRTPFNNWPRLTSF